MSIASRTVEVALFDYLAPIVKSDNLPPNSGSTGLPVKLVVIPAGLKTFEVPGNGVVNNFGDHAGVGRVLLFSVLMANGLYLESVGWYIPFPFLIPFVSHVFLVRVVGLLCGLFSFSVVRSPSLTPEGWALRSSFYAIALVMLFQSTRMFWGSAAWDSSYLVSYQYGWAAFYLLCGLCIVMYFYCVMGTAGLQIRRKPAAKKQTCIKCGYDTEGLEGKCPECDLEIGAFVPSKWRVNHWYLGAMFVVTFFSPVLVASVYSVFG